MIVIIDLTPSRCGTGSARLLDMVEGRSTNAFQTWLATRLQSWRDGVEVVAMDGFTGYKSAVAHELPEAVTVMDPFHVVYLAGDAWRHLPLAGDDEVRRRRQQDLHGHRGRSGDPPFGARRLLHTGANLHTDRQRAPLNVLFATEDHDEVEATWGIYQRMIAAYRDPNRRTGEQALVEVIDALATAVPRKLSEPHRLGRPEATNRKHPGLLQAPRHLQRAHRGHQWSPGALAGLRSRVPQPQPLHRKIAT